MVKILGLERRERSVAGFEDGEILVKRLNTGRMTYISLLPSMQKKTWTTKGISLPDRDWAVIDAIATATATNRHRIAASILKAFVADHQTPNESPTADAVRLS